MARSDVWIVAACAWLLGGGCGVGGSADAGADGGRPCLDAALLCGTACVDPGSNPDHCGACGVVCPAGDVCMSGHCALPSLPCGEGLADCRGACRDLRVDPANCGGCGITCAAGTVCSEGICAAVCGGETTLCGDVCVATRSDPQHCGGCGVMCPGPTARGDAACVDGSCAIACDDDALLDASGTECLGCGSATLAAAGPVLYWRLGEPVGSAAFDISGNDLHGSYSSVTLGGPGVASDGDTALGMTDGRVTRASFGAFPTTAITVELWMRSSDATTSGTAFSYAGGVDNGLVLYNYRSLAIYVDGPNVGTGVALNDGVWHHVAVSWESATGDTRLYVDGAVAFTATLAAGAAIDPGGTLMLGQEQDCVGGCVDPAQRFIGDLDEVAIYDRVLSADEIAAHYRTVTCTR